MRLENKISIPVMLYGFLLIMSIHFGSLVFTELLGFFVFRFIDFDLFPYFRLVVLFFEIIYVVKILSKISKNKILDRSKLFNVLLTFIFLLIVWNLRQYNDYNYNVISCGNSLFEENFYEKLFGENNRNQIIVDNIENAVILVSILIYSIYRIGEMPKEKP